MYKDRMECEKKIRKKYKLEGYREAQYILIVVLI